MVPVVNEFCGLNSTPVSCLTLEGGALISSECLCNKGYRANDSNACLGMYT